MEDFLRNMYGNNAPPFVASPYPNGDEFDAGVMEVPAKPLKDAGMKTAEEIWWEITDGSRAGISRVSGGASGASGSGAESKGAMGMTLEDFLTRTREVAKEDEKGLSAVFAMDPAAADRLRPPLLPMSTINNPVLGFRNGMEAVGIDGGRGRKRPLIDPPDKSAVQRQKRMIKNRESAARSRERKQAYTVELESLVHQLEEENAQLETTAVDQSKKRFKEVIKKVVPVTFMKKPPKQLRRTRSM